MDEKDLQQLSEISETLLSVNSEVLAQPAAGALMAIIRMGFRAGFINGYCYATGDIKIVEASEESPDENGE